MQLLIENTKVYFDFGLVAHQAKAHGQKPTKHYGDCIKCGLLAVSIWCGQMAVGKWPWANGHGLLSLGHMCEGICPWVFDLT